MLIDIRDAFFDLIAEKASEDPEFMVISCDMEAFALKKFQETFPDRFINAGVAEQNAINIAAGLASTGKKVLIFGILSFISTRCYEQIKLNICGMNLPVIIVGIGPGVSFSFDGPTHHATNDISIMRQLPELRIMNPNDEITAKFSAKLCLDFTAPSYVRLDKGKFPSKYSDDGDYLEGIVKIQKSDENLIVFSGTSFELLESTLKMLGEKSKHFSIINIVQITPVSVGLIYSLSKAENLIVLEENTLSGGIFNIISEIIVKNKFNPRVDFVTLENRHLFQYGSRDWLNKNNLKTSVKFNPIN
jgi:transketolase